MPFLLLKLNPDKRRIDEGLSVFGTVTSLDIHEALDKEHAEGKVTMVGICENSLGTVFVSDPLKTRPMNRPMRVPKTKRPPKVGPSAAQSPTVSVRPSFATL